MSVMTYRKAQANFDRVMDRAIDGGEEIIVRRKGGAVVVVSLKEWSSIQETLYLLSTPANAKALHGAIADLDAGKGIEPE